MYCSSDDAPDFYTETYPIARKDHRCCECNRPIQKGTKYARCCGKFDGTIFYEAQHTECRDFAADMNQTYGAGFCFIPFGEVDSAVEDAATWAPEDAKEIQAKWAFIKSGAAAMTDTGIITDPCCANPQITFTRDERVTYRAMFFDGKLLREPVAIQHGNDGNLHDEPEMVCTNCGTHSQLP